MAGKDLSKQDLIDAIMECWQENSAAVVDASILQGIGALGKG
ncbi:MULTISPECIES: hypothetical protein [Brasilonema]|nr:MULTISPECIES: hypothetical protein [Brasilonema]